MDSIISFFVDNFPAPKLIFTLGPCFLLWAYLCLALAGYCKSRHQVKTGYTRKLFHFLSFTTAFILQVFCGLPIVCLYGGMASLIVLYAIIRGNGHPLYEAMAREKDAPDRTYYIVIPYFATLIGAIASNILFAKAAIIGYLVCGLGDAAGEPIGTRYGKHRYKVPTFARVKTTRSIEGSIGVMIVSIVAITVGLYYIQTDFTWKTPVIILVVGIASALIEAVSPHGWDNTTMQIVPSWLVYVLLTVKL